ncbi:hypothetical protein JHU04_001102 [Brenneria sp. 4F2]|nr:hypothetical protein [Brenneria bubanii]
MKNKFKFDLLANKEIYCRENKHDLYFAMLQYTQRHCLIQQIETIDELTIALSEKRFFIAHNITYQKGRQTFFSGELVIASKNCLLEFIKKSIEIDDLRDFFISPVFEQCPDYVISIYDDSFYRHLPAITQLSQTCD